MAAAYNKTMKITKLGHCCLLIETDGARILTDPGKFSSGQNALTDLDAVLITHEHADHLHVESLKEVIKNNPNTKIITNTAVGKQLDKAGIPYSVIEGRATSDIKGVALEAFDAKHEEIYEEVGQVQNTGYFIANKLFYPGDAYADPERPVEILALPVAGPWCRLPDAIRYALRIKPVKAFPVHDGNLNWKFGAGITHRAPQQALKEHGIDFRPMTEGSVEKF
jgi:L-ascorbate metabolism protein UlaG (beta-lactamase superfamily)